MGDEAPLKHRLSASLGYCSAPLTPDPNRPTTLLGPYNHVRQTANSAAGCQPLAFPVPENVWSLLSTNFYHMNSFSESVVQESPVGLSSGSLSSCCSSEVCGNCNHLSKKTSQPPFRTVKTFPFPHHLGTVSFLMMTLILSFYESMLVASR